MTENALRDWAGISSDEKSTELFQNLIDLLGGHSNRDVADVLAYASAVWANDSPDPKYMMGVFIELQNSALETLLANEADR